MVRYQDIKLCVQDMLSNSEIECNAKDKTKIINFLIKYIDALIFNIVAICCVISFNMGIKKLTETHIMYMKKHLDTRLNITKSKKMSGGAFNTAAFYGIKEPQYSAGNSTADILNVDFNGGIARPEIPTLIGGGNVCSKLNKIVLKKIKDVFDFFKVSVKKDVRMTINNIFNNYIAQMITIIKKNQKELTEKKLILILSKSKIMKK